MAILKLKRVHLLLIIGAVLVFGLGAAVFLFPQNSVPPINSVLDLPSEENATDTNNMKLYRNEEWGFEFWYPKEWKIEENNIRTTSSKFNLILYLTGEPYQPHPPILLNIVTPDFGDYTFQNLDKAVSEVNISGITGERYDYKFGNIQRISILLPLNDSRIILGAGIGYEDVFNQILASFKFLK